MKSVSVVVVGLCVYRRVGLSTTNMERMLKRVGYYKKPVVSDTESGNNPSEQPQVRSGGGREIRQQRRRKQRSHSVRRTADDQLVSSNDSDDVLIRRLLRVFHQTASPACDWFASASMMEFTPKALTRRFCGRKCDNELYRSNSFKFERFDDKDEKSANGLDLAPLRKKVRSVFTTNLSAEPWNVNSHISCSNDNKTTVYQ